MTAPRVDILMFHSISDHAGPTNIAAPIFAAQMRALAESGLPVIALDDLVAAKAGGAALAERSVIITFDDGYQDFADTAWPVLRDLGLPAINYLPTGFVGEDDAWEPGPPRPIMGWDDIRRLAAEGAQFGSHTVSHPHLTECETGQLAVELAQSKAMIARETGLEVNHFAPPYGACNAVVAHEVKRHYQTCVTTRLAPASASDDLLNLPRIEMFYFQDAGRWNAFLAGKTSYLAARGLIRRIRGATGL